MKIFGVVLVLALMLPGTSFAADKTKTNWCYNYNRQKKYDKAISACTDRINSGKFAGIHLAIAYYDRGVAYGRTGKHDKAMADFKMAISLNPSYAKAYDNLGYTYSLEGDYNQAITNYSNAIKFNRSDAHAYFNRAREYTKNGNKEKALKDLAEAVKIDSNYKKVAKTDQTLKPLREDPGFKAITKGSQNTGDSNSEEW